MDDSLGGPVKKDRSVLFIAVRIFVAALMPIVLFLIWLFIEVSPGRSGILVTGKADERDFLVVQTYKTFLEPYQVSLYVRSDGENWRWYGLEHEDDAWDEARVVFDGEIAVVYRDGVESVRVELDQSEEAYLEQVLLGMGDTSGLTAEQVAEQHHKSYGGS